MRGSYHPLQGSKYVRTSGRGTMKGDTLVDHQCADIDLFTLQFSATNKSILLVEERYEFRSIMPSVTLSGKDESTSVPRG